MKFFIKDFFSKCDQIRSVTFTEEIPNGKLHFLCSDLRTPGLQMNILCKFNVTHVFLFNHLACVKSINQVFGTLTILLAFLTKFEIGITKGNMV